MTTDNICLTMPLDRVQQDALAGVRAAGWRGDFGPPWPQGGHLGKSSSRAANRNPTPAGWHGVKQVASSGRNTSSTRLNRKT